MKIIKKIAAFMFAFIMVISMGSHVMAAGGEGTLGTITINNAVAGQEYKLYKILTLESYDEGNKLYSYKPASEAWKAFLISEPAKEYVNVNEYDGVTWVEKDDETKEQKQARVAKFAQAALAYAKDSKHIINPEHSQEAKKKEGTNDVEVKFENLPLGYYLVDSSVGVLCGLNTTSPNASIEEKNGVPSVEKTVRSTKNEEYGKSNSVNIGDPVYFKTTITAQPGAQNYVLHDTMSEGLTLNGNSIKLTFKNETDELDPGNYTIKKEKSEITDSCTFEIEFTEAFCKTLTKDDKIFVTYEATLNENADIGKDVDQKNNKNTARLEYGDNKRVESSTNTYTYSVPVFKFTGTDKPLAGAKFILSDNKEGENFYHFIKLEVADGYEVYKIVKSADTQGNVDSIITSDIGKFKVLGLKQGVHYLTEVHAPDGYNQLKEPIKIVIAEDGSITYGSEASTSLTTMNDNIKIENKSGSLLPFTGGIGTKLFYIFGGILVVGSGVVLITKKRMK